MDSVLCDELLQEIFHRLSSSPSSSSAVSLVSKRWLRLLRSSTATLSLRLTSPPTSSSSSSSIIPSLSSFLSSHPYLSSLSVNSATSAAAASTTSSDHLLISVAFSCPNLKHLRFFPNPVSLSSLLSLSSSCTLLTSLKIALSRPLILYWVGRLRFLKELTLFITGRTPTPTGDPQLNYDPTELNLQSLSISGIRVGDNGLNWLWRNCNHLKRLKLTGCESVGDDSSFSKFIRSLKGLQEVELRTSRTIVDGVLLKLAESSVSLDSLLVYDGGSKQGLLQFIIHSRCRLRKLDLRLPLDLDDDHLLAIAENFRNLSSLQVQSCCLVTGEGLRTLANRMNKVLDELSLINCDAIERESGLLTTLGQSLKNLKNLDLSYNEMLNDKELTSMLASCCNLNRLKLRGCKSLSDASLTSSSLIRACKNLEVVDLMYCNGISDAGIESLVMKSRRLRQIHIEVTKITIAARTSASSKCIEMIVA